MQFANKPRTVVSIVEELKDGGFSLDSPYQRMTGQWKIIQKSKLVRCILIGYPIDPIRCDVKQKKEVFDGIQRISVLGEFYDDTFALSKSLDPVEIDGETFEIAGKKFSKLDPKLQRRFKNHEVSVYEFYDLTAENVREMFDGQSNGKPLNNAQKRSTVESDKLHKEINKLSKHAFISAHITKAQKTSAYDYEIIRQVMMLLVKGPCRMTSTEINKFLVEINQEINDDTLATIKQALDKLNKFNIEKDKKIAKLAMPMILYGACMAIQSKKDMKKYEKWLIEFLNTYDTQEDFLQYCSKSTATFEAVKGRVDFFMKALY